MGRMLSCGALWLMISHDSCVYLEVWTENAVVRAKTSAVFGSAWRRKGRRGCRPFWEGRSRGAQSWPKMMLRLWCLCERPSNLLLDALGCTTSANTALTFWLLPIFTIWTVLAIKTKCKAATLLFSKLPRFQTRLRCSNHSGGSLGNFRSLPWC